MRLPILILCLALCGCATHRKPSPVVISAPAITKVADPVAKTKAAVSRAKAKADELKPSVAPEGLVIWEDLQAQLTEANAKADQATTAIGLYQAEVEKQSSMLAQTIDAKNEALVQAEYWHAKQTKALREIWMWRGIAALIVGSVLAFFGLRFAGKTLV